MIRFWSLFISFLRGYFLHKHKIFEELSLRGFRNCSNSCTGRALNATRVNKQMRDGNSEILLLKVRTDSVSVKKSHSVGQCVLLSYGKLKLVKCVLATPESEASAFIAESG